MTFLLVALIAAATLGAYLTGRLHARHLWQKARPGYITGPPQGGNPDPLDWAFPPAPHLYDQERDQPPTPLNAALGNPLIPDPAVHAIDAAMTATQAALDRGDEFSRKATP